VYEVRFHGRGGQGAVLAAQALADAAFIEGNYGVAFPFFGAERRGAPVLAFTRVDKQKIYTKTQIYEPDYVVILDDKLIDLVNVAEGLKDDGMVIVNTDRKPEEIELAREVRLGCVDATTIALEVLGSPITNSAILGAFAKATGAIKIESIEQGILDIFGGKIGAKKAQRNAEAAREAFGRTTVGMSKAGREYPPVKKWLPTVQEMPTGLNTRKTETDAGLVGIGSFKENLTGSWRTFKPVYDQEKCIKCRFCWFYCPEGCIHEKEDDFMEWDMDYCKGCGICANVCPKDAITMER